MLRLILLLCAALFGVMLVGGRDYGQLRPGLAALQNDPAPAQASAEPAVAAGGSERSADAGGLAGNAGTA